MMADPSFLKSLVEFDKDGLSDKQVCESGGSVDTQAHLAMSIA